MSVVELFSVRYIIDNLNVHRLQALWVFIPSQISITWVGCLWEQKLVGQKKNTNFYFGIIVPLPLKTRRSPNATLYESKRLHAKTYLTLWDGHIIFIIRRLKNCLLNDSWFCMWCEMDHLMPGISRNFYFLRIFVIVTFFFYFYLFID